MEQLLEDIEIDVAMEQQDDETKVFDEEELLGSDSNTKVFSEVGVFDEPEFRKAFLPEASEPDRTGVLGTRAQEDLTKVQADNLSERMEQLLNDTKVRFDDLDKMTNVQLQKMREAVSKALEDYQVQGPPSRLEVNFLRQIIVSQYIGITTLAEEFKDQQQEHTKLVDKLIYESEAVAKKEKLIRETLEAMLQQYKKDDAKDFSCHLCQSPKHSAQMCAQFPNGETRQKEYRRQTRCINCTERGHHVESCPKRDAQCKECSGEYHRPYLCRVLATKEQTFEKIVINSKADEERKESAETKVLDL